MMIDHTRMAMADQEDEDGMQCTHTHTHAWGIMEDEGQADDMGDMMGLGGQRDEERGKWTSSERERR